MPKNPTSLRISDYTKAQIEQIAAYMNANQTEAVAMSVASFYRELFGNTNPMKEERTMSYTFDTMQDAIEAGFTLAKKGEGVKDTSGGNSFGYSFTRFDEDDKPVQKSVTVWLRQGRNRLGREGAFVEMFPPKE